MMKIAAWIFGGLALYFLISFFLAIRAGRRITHSKTADETKDGYDN